MNQPSSNQPAGASANSTWGFDNSTLGCFLFPALLIIFLTANWLWTSASTKQNLSTNWTNYESVFHQNLMRSLSEQHKFELDFSSEDWSAPYLDSSINGGGATYDWIFTYDANGATATHYPAIPVIRWLTTSSGLAELLEAFNSLFLALALTFLVFGIHKWFGLKASILCVVLLLLDPLLHTSPHFESLDGLLAALIILSFVALIHGINSSAENRVVWKYPIAGALLGATTLFQFQQNLWLALFLAAWICCLLVQLVRRQSLGRFFEGSLLFMIGLVVVVAPWWVRNCKSTGEFKPLGNAIHANLVGAYSDEAVSSSGNLNIEKILKHRMDTLSPFELSKMTLLEKEELVAQSNWDLATQWIDDNPTQLSRLIGDRIKNHLGFGDKNLFLSSPMIGNLSGTIAIAGAFACLLCWRRFGSVVLTIFLASLMVTALTWSDEGRLFIPVRPLLYAAFAVGLVEIMQRLKSGYKDEPHLKT